MTTHTLPLVSLANELETFIQNTVPDATTVSKYGGTLFTLKPDEKEGQFCGVFLYQKHVQLSFSKGAELTDPHQLLQGSGKLRRHINFTRLEETKFPELKKLLTQATQL